MLLTLALLFACDVNLVDIEVSGSTETTVEAGTVVETLLGDLGFTGLVEMDVTAAQELQNQGVKPGDISSAVLSELVFTAASGSPDLSFLDEVSLWVSAPELDTRLVASQDEFPEGQAVVAFELTGEEIAPYVVSQSMTLSTEVTAHRPDEDTVVRVDYAVIVGVTTQGAVSNIDR